MNTKTRSICALASALAFSAAAMAADGAKPATKQREPIRLAGVGTDSCGRYIANVSGSIGAEYKLFYQQWALGVFAGISLNSPSENPFADPETHSAWIDKWCKDSPDSTVLDAVLALAKRRK